MTKENNTKEKLKLIDNISPRYECHNNEKKNFSFTLKVISYFDNVLGYEHTQIHADIGNYALHAAVFNSSCAYSFVFMLCPICERQFWCNRIGTNQIFVDIIEPCLKSSGLCKCKSQFDIRIETGVHL